MFLYLLLYDACMTLILLIKGYPVSDRINDVIVSLGVVTKRGGKQITVTSINNSKTSNKK